MCKIAVIFDFDDTLVPDSATLLLQKHGVDPNKFWKRDLKALIKAGYDPCHGFLKLILDLVGDGKPLENLTNNYLNRFGASLDDKFYTGLPGLFKDLRGIVKKFKDIAIEFYIISGGLQEIIMGSKIIKKHFNGVYGCKLEGSGNLPVLKHIKRAVSFTEKTRYLFEISKGIDSKSSLENPFLVNERVDNRRIKFKNMIYVGDGITDIPCFSLIDKNGGTCFGVFDASNTEKAKHALMKLLQPRRVISVHSPRYGKHDDLGSLIRAAVTKLCLEFQVQQKTTQPQST